MKIVETIEKVVLVVFLVLLPVVFLVFFANPFVLPKILLLVGAVTLLVVLKATKMVVSGATGFSLSKFDVPVILLMVAYIVSALVKTPNKFDAFFIPGGATIIVSGGLLYFLINQTEAKTKSFLAEVLVYSGALLSFFVILASFNLLSVIPQMPEFAKIATFNPIGDNISSFVFLLVLIPLSIGKIISKKDAVDKAVIVISLILIVFGISLSAVNLITDDGLGKLLPLGTSLSVTVDALKNNFLLGVGPGNYSTAFSRYLPIEYNQTDLWNARFSVGRGIYDNILVETGLLGLIAVAYLLVTVFKDIKTKWKKDFKIVSIAVLMGMALLLPTNLVVVTLLFILMAIGKSDEKMDLPLGTVKNKLPAYIVGGAMVVPFIVLWVFSVRFVSAEYDYSKSVRSFSANQGVETYTLLGEAIQKNPRIDRYRASYAQVNMLLANSIANDSSEKISEEDKRNQVSTLIQQAIREAKATVALNPYRSSNWEILGSTYRSIIPFTQGADQFAIDSYGQAVALDPLNPTTRIALGGLYYASGDYDSAIDVFKLAVVAKPDLANSHYNLAVAYREKEEYAKAIAEMTNVLALVDVDSEDYTLAKAELTALESKTPSEEGNSANLTPPQQQPAPVITPPLDLPEDAAPPATSAPSPTPVVEATPTPTP